MPRVGQAGEEFLEKLRKAINTLMLCIVNVLGVVFCGRREANGNTMGGNRISLCV